MTVEKNPFKFYNRNYWQLSNLVHKIYYGQAILSHDFDGCWNQCSSWMALGAFILCGYFSIKEVKFTFMATYPPNKSAWMPILDVPIIDNIVNLRYIHNSYIMH